MARSKTVGPYRIDTQEGRVVEGPVETSWKWGKREGLD